MAQNFRRGAVRVNVPSGSEVMKSYRRSVTSFAGIRTNKTPVEMAANLFADAQNVYMNEEYVLSTRKRLSPLYQSALPKESIVIDSVHLGNRFFAIVGTSSATYKSYKFYELGAKTADLSGDLRFAENSRLFVIGTKVYITRCINGDVLGLYIYNTSNPDAVLVSATSPDVAYIPTLNRDANNHLIVATDTPEELNLFSDKYSIPGANRFSNTAINTEIADDCRQNINQSYVVVNADPTKVKQIVNSQGDVFTANVECSTKHIKDGLTWLNSHYDLNIVCSIQVTNADGTFIDVTTNSTKLGETKLPHEAYWFEKSRLSKIIPFQIRTSGGTIHDIILQVGTRLIMVSCTADSATVANIDLPQLNSSILASINDTSSPGIILYEYQNITEINEHLCIDSIVCKTFLSLSNGKWSATNPSPLPYASSSYNEEDETYNVPEISGVIKCTDDGVDTYLAAVFRTTNPQSLENSDDPTLFVKIPADPANGIMTTITGSMLALKKWRLVEEVMTSEDYDDPPYDNLKFFPNITGLFLVEGTTAIFWANSLDNSKKSVLCAVDFSQANLSAYVIQDISAHHDAVAPKFKTSVFTRVVNSNTKIVIISSLAERTIAVLSGTWTTTDGLNVTDKVINGIFSTPINIYEKSISADNPVINPVNLGNEPYYELICGCVGGTITVPVTSNLDDNNFTDTYHITSAYTLSAADGELYFRWANVRNKMGQITGVYIMNNFLVYTTANAFIYSSAFDDTYVRVNDYHDMLNEGEITELLVVSPTAAIAFTSLSAYWILGSGSGSIENLVPVMSQFEIKNVVHRASSKLALTDMPVVFTERGVIGFEDNSQVTDTSRNLITLSDNIDSLFHKMYSSSARNGIFTARFKWFNIFAQADNTSTRCLLYDCRTSTWWYWVFPVSLVDIFQEDEVLYAVSKTGMVYILDDEVTKCYDELSTPNVKTKIDWFVQSHATSLGVRSSGKSLKSTTFMFAHNLALNRNDEGDVTSFEAEHNCVSVRLTAYNTPDIRDVVKFDITDYIHQLGTVYSRSSIPKFNYLSYRISNTDINDNSDLCLALTEIIFEFKVFGKIA